MWTNVSNDDDQATYNYGNVRTLSLSLSLSLADDSEETLLHQFSHALSLWCVAVEEAGSHANQRGSLLPGTMRQALIDALHYLTESHVRSAAKLSLYCMRTGKPS